VTGNEALVERIDREGHLIGNHSFHHKATFGFQSQSGVRQELLLTEEAIADILGKRPRLFRPPFGVTNPMIARAARKSKSVTIGWSVRSFDTIISDPAKLYRRITQRLKPGDIILFHDYSKSMISVLPAFLQHVHDTGLKIVSLEELLNEKAYR
jgi:peptidoglycan/xylan/chitin deacetylase (PgdA/CDA1 family)